MGIGKATKAKGPNRKEIAAEAETFVVAYRKVVRAPATIIAGRVREADPIDLTAGGEIMRAIVNSHGLAIRQALSVALAAGHIYRGFESRIAKLDAELLVSLIEALGIDRSVITANENSSAALVN